MLMIPPRCWGWREHFSLPESLRVLSHWDLGVIERVREFRRGSRRSPKLRIAADSGEYLLKRRAPGRADISRVELAHELIDLLAATGYPTAPVVPTRAGASFVELDGRLYELFRYIDSTGYPKSADAAGAAGDALARLHLTTASVTPSEPIEGASFHASRIIEGAFDQIPAAVAGVEPDHDASELGHTCRLLRKGYREAARRVEASGWASFPRQVIHGDWHPGNVLFHGNAVAAVLDFDSARIEPRVVDVANGLLQFTMLMGAPDDPVAWPDGFDVKRLDAFLRRYDQALRSGGPPEGSARGSEGGPISAGLSVDEQHALPWLMIEALVSESALPIAATGSFASIRGSAFLRMVEKKVDWIWRRSARLKKLLAPVTRPHVAPGKSHSPTSATHAVGRASESAATSCRRAVTGVSGRAVPALRTPRRSVLVAEDHEHAIAPHLREADDVVYDRVARHATRRNQRPIRPSKHMS